MDLVLNMLRAAELSLRVVHEMDAIRGKEWKMFIILKDMPEEKAYPIFMLLHIPLYTAILFLLFSSFFQAGYYIVDIFLIAHLLLHLFFRDHPANRLNGPISKWIIYSSGALAVLHLIGWFVF